MFLLCITYSDTVCTRIVFSSNYKKVESRECLHKIISLGGFTLCVTYVTIIPIIKVHCTHSWLALLEANRYMLYLKVCIHTAYV